MKFRVCIKSVAKLLYYIATEVLSDHEFYIGIPFILT